MLPARNSRIEAVEIQTNVANATAMSKFKYWHRAKNFIHEGQPQEWLIKISTWFTWGKELYRLSSGPLSHGEAKSIETWVWKMWKFCGEDFNFTYSFFFFGGDCRVTYVKYWLNLTYFLRGTKAKQNKRCQELLEKSQWWGSCNSTVFQFSLLSHPSDIPSTCSPKQTTGNILPTSRMCSHGNSWRLKKIFEKDGKSTSGVIQLYWLFWSLLL